MSPLVLFIDKDLKRKKNNMILYIYIYNVVVMIAMIVCRLWFPFHVSGSRSYCHVARFAFLFCFVFFPHFLIIFFFHPFLCQIVDVLMTSFCRCVVLPFFFVFFFNVSSLFLSRFVSPSPPPYFTSSLLALPFRVLPSGKRSYELSVISKNCEQKKKKEFYGPSIK
ncbi:hypothetical protein Tb11.01.0210 [Trypanosoma brucei brucei TREU927]|uniref:T. brucei spp.-specific protein n=1 Tax=Trypanosoma brucei brucei (strain 927/4 GUTat10.1) TaxID=185431 RepID=Q384I5_TRYB2|nr:hypothetical protein Tb11.01.0210 [Trypanosoma brucei brucei TREU927]EAN79796.1 hypothetical protein Tb11.01.0210 [Trypanosoma brucei brucei TREU927]